MDLFGAARKSDDNSRTLASFLPSIRFWRREKVDGNSAEDSVATTVLELFSECDRVDTMPADEKRDKAMADLLSRVEIFEEEVPVPNKDAAFLKVMEVN